MSEPAKCPACGESRDPLFVWQTVAGVRRIRSLCAACGWTLGWEEPTPDNAARADANDSPKQGVLF